MQINWQQFGLKNNPYDTSPLIEGGDIAIEDAFVGRNQERQFLKGIFESENRVCLTICGDTGVGKTSLANFHKFIWKYRTQKLLFSFRREMEACDDLLDKKSFIIEILGSVLREIKLIEPSLLKSELLTKIQVLVDISQTINISGGISAGFSGYSGGIDFGKGKNVFQPVRFSTTVLEEYFVNLVEFIKSNKIGGHVYSGLIIHVNNFDVVLSDKRKSNTVVNFFSEIRDILQTKDTYFLFLGPKNFFKDIIAAEERVKSVFYQTPLTLNPLSKSEVIEAFDERLKLLKSVDVAEFIKPINDEVVYRLHDLYNGRIRSIMSAVRDILGYSSEKVTNPLSVNEAMILLGRERMERIDVTNKLTKGQKNILKFLVESGKYMSLSEASKILEKPISNISGHYFKPLREMGVIEEKEKSGRTILWGLTTDYEPLKWFYESQKEVMKVIENVTGKESTLFDSIE